MSARSTAARWARAHPDLVEGGAGFAAGAAVVAVSLLQWGLTPDGWTRGITLGFATGLVVGYAVRRDRRLRESRERAAAEQRLELARDLHDAVANQVAIIGVQAAAGRRVLATHPDRAEQALATIELAARAANLNLRAMLGALRADASRASGSRGLADLQALATEFQRSGLSVEVTGRESLPSLPAGLDAAAYRIIQECLSNALAHAGAVRASVELAHADGVLTITVRNEAGAPTVAHAGTGLGLTGMRERAELFGGRLDASPQPDGSFVVEATIPVAAR